MLPRMASMECERTVGFEMPVVVAKACTTGDAAIRARYLSILPAAFHVTD